MFRNDLSNDSNNFHAKIINTNKSPTTKSTTQTATNKQIIIFVVVVAHQKQTARTGRSFRAWIGPSIDPLSDARIRSISVGFRHDGSNQVSFINWFFPSFHRTFYRFLLLLPINNSWNKSILHVYVRSTTSGSLKHHKLHHTNLSSSISRQLFFCLFCRPQIPCRPSMALSRSVIAIISLLSRIPTRITNNTDDTAWKKQ